MKNFAIILLIWNILQLIEAKKLAYFTRVECPAPLTDLVQDYKCSVGKNADAVPNMSVSFKLKEDVSNITMHIKVRGKQEGKQEETLLVFDLDVCDALSATHDHFFLKMMFTELRRTSNFPTDCPLKKDIVYAINGYTIDSTALPGYLPEITWITYAYFNVSNQRIGEFNGYGKLSEKIEA